MGGGGGGGAETSAAVFKRIFMVQNVLKHSAF